MFTLCGRLHFPVSFGQVGASLPLPSCLPSATREERMERAPRTEEEIERDRRRAVPGTVPSNGNPTGHMIARVSKAVSKSESLLASL